MTRVLVIEDNPDVVEMVELHLRDAGYHVDTALTGRRGLELALSGSHDLIVLDVMLPFVDGLEICRRVRVRDATTPIIMLTAKSTELDRVLGLELGSDDYLTKPFSIRELLARIRALLRRGEALRTAAHTPPPQVEIGPFRIDVGGRRVNLDGRSLDLTAREFELLHYFASHPGRVFTRSDLLDHVWGYGHRGYEHTVNTHINRLRAKVETNPSKPSFILTVWGVGYKFFDPAEVSA